MLWSVLSILFQGQTLATQETTTKNKQTNKQTNKQQQQQQQTTTKQNFTDTYVHAEKESSRVWHYFCKKG
jgi:hypothetical protein